MLLQALFYLVQNRYLDEENPFEFLSPLRFDLLSGLKSPAKILSIVDFPAPFFPTRPTLSPEPNRKVTSSNR
jgi:hypothetical protein